MATTLYIPDNPPADPATSPPPTPEEIAARRRHCTWLEYWRDCPVPSCRRAHVCVGDPAACYYRHWLRHSDAARIWVHAGIAALEYGLSARAAAAMANHVLLDHVKTTDRLPRHPPRRRRRLSNKGDARRARPNCGNEA